MDAWLRIKQRFFPENTEASAEQTRVHEELNRIVMEMHAAETAFNQADADSLTESSIYALKALNARYRYWHEEACRLAQKSAETIEKKEHGNVKMGIGMLVRFCRERCFAVVGKMQSAVSKHLESNRAQ